MYVYNAKSKPMSLPRAYTHTHTHTYTHTHTCIHAYTHTHAYTHARIHTHTHTYINQPFQKGRAQSHHPKIGVPTSANQQTTFWPN